MATMSRMGSMLRKAMCQASTATRPVTMSARPVQMRATAGFYSLSLKAGARSSVLVGRSRNLFAEPVRRSFCIRAESEASEAAEQSESAPALADPCKLYVGNLSWDTQAESLTSAFGEYGTVLSCDVVMDATGRSRGFGFVSYESASEATVAVEALNGTVIDGRELRVDYHQQGRTARSSRERSGPSRAGNRIYIGNLPWRFDDYDLKDAFDEYGTVEDARVITDRETGRSRGFGFVTMADAEDMEKAIIALDGAECDGRQLRVNKAERN